MKTSLASILMMAFLLLTDSSFAQDWYFSAQTGQEYTETPFSYRYTNPSLISSFSGEIGWSNDFLSIYWDPRFQSYSGDPDYNYLGEDLTLSLLSGKWTSEFGLSHQLSINEVAGLTFIRPFAGFYFRDESETGWFESGASVSGTWYQDAEELDQLVLSGYTEWNTSFETRTSLTLGTELSGKYFLTEPTTGTGVIPATTSLMSEEFTGLSIEGNGRGKGQGNGIEGSGMMGNGKNAGSSRIARQLAGISDSWFKVSQNINSWSSVNLSGDLHWVLSAQNEKKSSSVSAIASEWLDDNSGYNSQGLQAGVTFLLPSEWKTTLTGSYLLKQYTSQVAWSDSVLVSSDLRTDDRPGLSLSAEKTFFFDFAPGQTLDFKLSGYYQKNNSNSYWYQYPASGAKLSLSWTF